MNKSAWSIVGGGNSDIAQQKYCWVQSVPAPLHPPQGPNAAEVLLSAVCTSTASSTTRS